MNQADAGVPRHTFFAPERQQTPTPGHFRYSTYPISPGLAAGEYRSNLFSTTARDAQQNNRETGWQYPPEVPEDELPTAPTQHEYHRANMSATSESEGEQTPNPNHMSSGLTAAAPDSTNNMPTTTGSPFSPSSFTDYPQSAYNYGTWTAMEDRTLMTARGQGRHWANIQRTHFPSKTANACRKRYERLMERKGMYDLDRTRLERVAHEYMDMRKEIWSPLAARVGERWHVVEAQANICYLRIVQLVRVILLTTSCCEKQCMSAGLRAIQLNARTHARRRRNESRASQRTAGGVIPGPSPFPPPDIHVNNSGGNNNLLLAPVGFSRSPVDEEHHRQHHFGPPPHNTGAGPSPQNFAASSQQPHYASREGPSHAHHIDDNTPLDPRLEYQGYVESGHYD